ncbi:MAG: hypothetical protein H0X38_04650 [Planctomycetes bacterium]|nr:hypothetical protein [Planctomycetota bacterium]
MRVSHLIPVLMFGLAWTGIPLTAAEVHGATSEVLRLYDISDLTALARDFPARPLSDRMPPVSAIPDQAAADLAPTTSALLDRWFTPAVAALLRSHSEVRGATLLVTGTPTMQAHVERVLAVERQRHSAQVSMHATVCLMEAAHRHQHYPLATLRWRALDGQPGLAVAELTAAERAHLLEQFALDGEAQVVFQPTMTTFAGQLANAAQFAQRAYLAPIFAEHGAQTQIQVLTYGHTLEARATPTDDHAFVHLQVTHTCLDLLAMTRVAIPIVPVDHAEAVEVPQTATASEYLDQAVISGGTLIVATGVYHDQQHGSRVGFLLITAEVVEPSATP